MLSIYTPIAESEIEIMHEDLETMFFSVLQEGDMSGAIDFIKCLDAKMLPSKKIMSAIIFQILMESDDIKCLAFAFDYLSTLVNFIPPRTDDLRTLYYDSVQDCQGPPGDLWQVFSRIVNSCFYHRSIYGIKKAGETDEPIKYPNCKFLLEFYVKLFRVDYEYSKRSRSCLIMRLLWPDHEIRVKTHRTKKFLQWIEDIYGNWDKNTMGDLLECLHDVFTLMVKCFFEVNPELSEAAAFKHQGLLGVVHQTMNCCKNTFANQEKLRVFFASLSVIKCFQVRISESIVKHCIKQTPKRTNSLFTLKDIVYQCMFPQKIDKRENARPPVNIEKNLRSKKVRLRKKSGASSNKKTGTTKLHEFAKQNKFGDLHEALYKSPEDINAKDGTGSTPLHEACQAGNRMCVNVLVKESQKDSIPNLDLTACNMEGLTALHLAVKANSVEIVRELLNAGGSGALNVRDNEGRKPSDWSTSKKMRELLQEHQPEVGSTESASTTERSLVKEAPKLKTFKEYSIYLQALTSLLSTYCELFNVYDYVRKKNSVVKSHASKTCCHYLEEAVCSEDASIAPQMRDLTTALIESVKKNIETESLKINIDIELIPLQAFAASLIPS